MQSFQGFQHFHRQALHGKIEGSEFNIHKPQQNAATPSRNL